MTFDDISDFFILFSNLEVVKPKKYGYHDITLIVPGGKKSKIIIEILDKNKEAWVFDIPWVTIRGIRFDQDVNIPLKIKYWNNQCPVDP